MATFDYSAIDHNGKQQKGILEADSPRQVRQKLRAINLVPLMVSSTSDSIDKFSKQYKTSLSPTALAIMTRQLAVLLKSGMPLTQALQGLCKQTQGRTNRVLSVVQSSVREGSSLSRSLSRFPKSFDQLYCATVEAGEHTGRLDMVLEQLAQHTESQRSFRQKIQVALIYPVLLVILSISIVVGLMTYIVPDVIKVFIDTGQTLPLLTRLLLACSDFLSNWSHLLVIALAVIIAGVAAALRLPAIRRAIHQVYLHIPLIKTISSGVNAQRYMQTLGILSLSGLPLHKGMQIARQVIKNSYLKAQLADVSAKVREGQSLSHSLEQMGYFPPLMVYMLASGEASGELDQMLLKAAQQQMQDIQTRVATAVSLFEPLMLLLMGGIVLLIVLAILLPILNMNQLIG